MRKEGEGCTSAFALLSAVISGPLKAASVSKTSSPSELWCRRDTTSPPKKLRWHDKPWCTFTVATATRQPLKHLAEHTRIFTQHAN